MNLVRLVSIFMEIQRFFHLFATKKILRYIRGTTNHEILVPHQQNTIMEANVYGCSNSDWSGDQYDRKIT